MSELSDLTLNFSLRDKIGTSASKQIRAQGRIPAVLYGKEVNRTLSVDDKEMRILLRKAEGTSSLMRLIGEGGEDELVLIKELQEDKIRDTICTCMETSRCQCGLAVTGRLQGVAKHHRCRGLQAAE